MNMKNLMKWSIVVMPLMAAAMQASAQQSILDRVKARGHLNCSSSQGVPGLSRPDEKGEWVGFDSDICRAVATAVFGDKTKVRYTPLNAAQRLPAVQTGEIDLLARTTTLTFERDLSIRFVDKYLIDSDAILVKKNGPIKTKKNLNGRTICLQGGGSLVEKALDKMEQEDKIKVKRVYFDSTIQARDSYFAGRCDGYITDGLAAAGQRAGSKNPEEHNLIYSGKHKEALGTGIPRGDDKWFDIVRWSINVLHYAEEKGVTQANIDQKIASGDADIKKVFGGESGWGKKIGLDDKWAYNIIKQLGNYGEIFDRHLGKDSPLKAQRGLNNNHENGGLMFAYPMTY